MQGELHPSTSRSGYSVRYNKFIGSVRLSLDYLIPFQLLSSNPLGWSRWDSNPLPLECKFVVTLVFYCFVPNRQLSVGMVKQGLIE
jgi:hypothetical protein